MKTYKPAIIISVPYVWGVRNVLRSGLYEILDQKFRVILAVPEIGKASLFNENIAEEDIMVLPSIKKSRVYTYLLTVLKMSYQRSHPIPTNQVFNKWKSAQNRSSALNTARNNILNLLSYPLSSQRWFSYFRQKEYEIYLKLIPKSVNNAIQEIKPVAGLSTILVSGKEFALFRTLQSLGIPTLSHILSFDNLTSYGYIPVYGFDKYLVWQQRMRDELGTFFGIPNEQCVITGTPQFDFHVNPEFIWSLEKTYHLLGLLQTKPYFVYCANHYSHTPTEPQLVKGIIKATLKHDDLKNYQWVIRLHPMDNYSRWDEILEEYPHVVISRPWKHEDNFYWSLPSREEIGLLGNTLRYAHACLTVASTIALDCSVVNTPIINVGFNTFGTQAENQYYFDAHFTYHYAPISNSGATRLVKNMNELINQLIDAVNARDLYKGAREKLAQEICGPVDGHASERIAEAVTESMVKS